MPLQMILREGRSSPGRSGSCPANTRKCLQETRGEATPDVARVSHATRNIDYKYILIYVMLSCLPRDEELQTGMVLGHQSGMGATPGATRPTI